MKKQKVSFIAGFPKLFCKWPPLKKLKKPWLPSTKLLIDYHKKHLKTFFFAFHLPLENI